MHTPKNAIGLVCGTHDLATARPSTERTESGRPRAKHLKLSHANPAMHARRHRVVALLRDLFGDEKQIAVAAVFGVSRTLALRWMDADAVDRNPAPLALLYAVDEQTFEAIVAALRSDRAAMREGR